MKVIYHPHGDAEPRGYMPPILDRDGKVLVPGQLVPPRDRRAKRVFEPGEPFDINEREEPLLAQFCKLHDDFQIVNASAHPQKQPEF